MHINMYALFYTTTPIIINIYPMVKLRMNRLLRNIMYAILLLMYDGDKVNGIEPFLCKADKQSSTVVITDIFFIWTTIFIALQTVTVYYLYTVLTD